MRRFDGILICSDWDGTLHSDDGIHQADIAAIKHFQRNGGLFTICSGRQLAHLKGFFNEFEPNTNVITLNGAIIANHKSNDVAYRGFLDEKVASIVEQFFALKIPFSFVSLYYDDSGEAIRANITSYEEFRSIESKYKLYKVVFVVKDEESVSALKQKVGSIDASGYTLASS